MPVDVLGMLVMLASISLIVTLFNCDDIKITASVLLGTILLWIWLSVATSEPWSPHHAETSSVTLYRGAEIISYTDIFGNIQTMNLNKYLGKIIRGKTVKVTINKRWYYGIYFSGITPHYGVTID